MTIIRIIHVCSLLYCSCSDKSDSSGCYWHYLGQGNDYQILAGPVFMIVFSISGVPLGKSKSDICERVLTSRSVLFIWLHIVVKWLRIHVEYYTFFNVNDRVYGVLIWHETILIKWAGRDHFALNEIHVWIIDKSA